MCRTQRRNRRLRRRAVPEPLDALESRAKGGERRSPPPHTPRPPTERTGPARAPRSASRIPPSKIWNRWRGGSSDAYLLWRQFLCAAPRARGSARARTTTHHRSPVDLAPARAGASPRPVDPTFTKDVKVGKRAADAREDLERLGQWGRWRCRNSVAIALSDERRHGDARPRAGGARVFTGEAGVGRGVSQRAVAPHRARERGRVRADLLLRVYVLRTRRPRA